MADLFYILDTTMKKLFSTKSHYCRRQPTSILSILSIYVRPNTDWRICACPAAVIIVFKVVCVSGTSAVREHPTGHKSVVVVPVRKCSATRAWVRGEGTGTGALTFQFRWKTIGISATTTIHEPFTSLCLGIEVITGNICPTWACNGRQATSCKSTKTAHIRLKCVTSRDCSVPQNISIISE